MCTWQALSGGPRLILGQSNSFEQDKIFKNHIAAQSCSILSKNPIHVENEGYSGKGKLT
jgi:hypothetical protein